MGLPTRRARVATHVRTHQERHLKGELGEQRLEGPARLIREDLPRSDFPLVQGDGAFHALGVEVLEQTLRLSRLAEGATAGRHCQGTIQIKNDEPVAFAVSGVKSPLILLSRTLWAQFLFLV